MHVRAKDEGNVPIVDPKKLEQFMQQFVGDLGAAMGASLVLIGDELGLYRALADAGSPLSPKELAELTATDPRYIQEWLAAEAAANYVVYDKATGKYTMTPEQAFTLAYEDSPGNVTGAFQIVSALVKRPAQDHRSLSWRQRSRLARASSCTVYRHRAFANDKVEDNLNPVGRVYYAASTMICTPASRSQEVGLALGAQAGPAKIEEVVRAAGFSQFRQVAETPFNRVFEAKV